MKPCKGFDYTFVLFFWWIYYQKVFFCLVPGGKIAGKWTPKINLTRFFANKTLIFGPIAINFFWKIQSYMTKVQVCLNVIWGLYGLLNIIPKTKDPYKLFLKLESWIFAIETVIFGPICINFFLKNAKLYEKSHYMPKCHLRLKRIAQSYSKN